MDSSSAQQHHHQEMGLQTLESMLGCKDNKKARPADMQALKCPRCDSTNTKFCYYNNYSLSQPRYFCKSCRRYWTKGGTLRNVPVGGGCRKNKRSSSSSSSATSTSSSSKRSPPAPLPPPLNYDSNDLNLAIARLHTHNSAHLGLDDHRDFSIWGNSTVNPNSDVLSGGGFSGAAASSSGLFDAIRSGVFDNGNNGMQNLYYGGGNVEMGGTHEMGMSMSMSMPPAPASYDDYGGGGVVSTSTAVTTVKHEVCRRDGDGVDGRILWGFPWQNVNNVGGAGAGDGNGSDFDSARLNWSGIAASNWQGLLNSPLT